MSEHVLAGLEPDDKIAKRAHYEGFEFELEAPGLVRVTNGSHADPDEHSYLVDVTDGVPTACECPAAEYHGFPCKHAVAVALREPVLEAATERTVVPDGGTVVATDAGDAGDQQRPEDCGCDGLDGGLPCWPCYQEGFATVKPATDGPEGDD